MNCRICPHNCQIDRQKSFGVCQAPATFKIAHLQLHRWEEPCISGSNGSGTIFFSHCNLSCVFCQNQPISQAGQGKPLSDQEFILLCQKLALQGADNLNLVTPTCYTDLLIKILPQIKEDFRLPIIWNSNAYENVDSLNKLNGLVDVYLPDLKYFDNHLAKQYSKIENYFNFALKAIEEMVRQQPEIEIDERGLIQRGVIIRHLVLPGSIADSKKILKAIKDNFGKRVWVSLLAQYYPLSNIKDYPMLNRYLAKEEYLEIKNYYDSLNFSGGYFQELNSATPNYTPRWDQKTLE